VSPKLEPIPAWGHGTGTLNLTLSQQRDFTFDDRSSLLECLHRYCWGFDERRTDLLGEVFAKDAEWEALVMGETRIGPFVGHDQVSEWLTRFWKFQKDQRRHMIVNFMVEELSEREAMAVAYLLLAGSTRAHSEVEITGFYRVRFTKEDGRWQISRLFGGFDAPFWKMPLADMTPELRALFGITSTADESTLPD
jgi:hypothetical protein